MSDERLPAVVEWDGCLLLPIARYDGPTYVLENPMTGERITRLVSTCTKPNPSEAMEQLASSLRDRNALLRNDPVVFRLPED